MKPFIYTFLIFFLLSTQSLLAQKQTDSNIFGHVVSKGEHLPFVSIAIKGTAIGTATDQTGHFRLLDVPLGKITLIASFVGYKTQEINVFTESNKTIEINFELMEDALRLDEVVVTGKKDGERRGEASFIVNSISAQLFSNTQALTLGEGLNYCSGLRLETNCSNCGFTQVRLNGLEGPYSQILINGRAIFSGLAGVYGLELIPAAMIEKVEVTRGGGSAQYGGNAIAGTINLKLKDPLSNSWEIGTDVQKVGIGLFGNTKASNDLSYNFTTSIVTDDHKTGLAVFGILRNRQPLDVNDDSFTEITQLDNTSLGSRLYHRFDDRTKLTADFFYVNEFRRGGNKLHLPEHEADIAESLKHKIGSGALTLERFIGKESLGTLFFAGQSVKRDSYYGAQKSLKDYGVTNDFTYNSGFHFKSSLKSVQITTGLEQTSSVLTDKKKGYSDWENAVIEADTISNVPFVEDNITAHQQSTTTALFLQLDQSWKRYKYTIGGRLDHYRIKDLDHQSDVVSAFVFSPRLNLMADLSPNIQARISYSTGFRAPQIFDEDLHIEASASRKIIHINSPDLRQESSQSFMASLDLTLDKGRSSLFFLAEGFYTQLMNPFVNTYGEPDAEGVVVYTRSNAKGTAMVYGMNLELNWIPINKVNTTIGYSLQTSKYSDPQEFGQTKFLRTPNQHGFFIFDWKPSKKLLIAASGTFTGKMLLAYFGPTIPNPDEGELRTSKSFTDIGLKVQYTFKINNASLQLYAGIKNLLNEYQSDFDYGPDRDPAYVYGPAAPRTVYAGLKIGNLL